jgi:hypothetical protein
MKRKLSLKTRKKSNRKLPKKTLKKVYDLYNGDKWDNYRLGDVIYGHFICWNKVCLNKTIKDKHLLTTLCDGLEHDLEHDTEQDNVVWCKHNTDNWADPKNLKIGYLDSIHKNFPNSIADKYVKLVGYPTNFRVSDFDALKSIFSKLKYIKSRVVRNASLRLPAILMSITNIWIITVPSYVNIWFIFYILKCCSEILNILWNISI